MLDFLKAVPFIIIVTVLTQPETFGLPYGLIDAVIMVTTLMGFIFQNTEKFITGSLSSTIRGLPKYIFILLIVMNIFYLSYLYCNNETFIEQYWIMWHNSFLLIMLFSIVYCVDEYYEKQIFPDFINKFDDKQIYYTFLTIIYIIAKLIEFGWIRIKN
ncbi:hypothetical protein QJU89_07020 [Pasteurella skyensis]|uniref:Uncharacterized protein n=1 Tax=Phocoenobacter skyensis TaxID=97481 RepID=A0AAJ6N9N6_9PAST|nr:hypothetical protein [Pasteurella skyensis]MDP8162627.1 hypothetical protein [Pasteurella skyensis]MDP8172775.1 hypothetical protein [Pasteurella skyensis]MDP8177381.1 hypothetical protein [Pasteurella skyensis]MDP8179308.1 hypothetical protein [Pasteurella skyensis]MDP8183445.1 hypothetical protein [Pasteurella skyensis]